MQAVQQVRTCLTLADFSSESEDKKENTPKLRDELGGMLSHQKFFLFVWEFVEGELSSAGSFPKYPYGQGGQKLGASSSMQVSHMEWRKPNSLNHPCCLPGCMLAGSWA